MTGLKRLIIIISIMVMTMSLLPAQLVRFLSSTKELKQGEAGVIHAFLDIPEGKHQTFNPKETEDAYLSLKAENPDFVFGKVKYPKPKIIKSDEEWEYHNTIMLSLPFRIKPNAPIGNKTVNLEFGYNLCYDAGWCEPPETVTDKMVIKVVKGEPDTAAKDTLVAIASTQVPTVSESLNSNREQNGKSVPVNNTEKNILKYLLMAFIGGLILNIMPCVLPVLSIKAMSIVKQAHEDKSVIMKHSFAYTGGILVSFLVLATVIIILKIAGEAVGWGFQFQNTTFVLVLTSIIFVFALSLFDVFIVNPPGMTTATKASSKGGVSGSFFSGIFAVLLATPCSAPMLGTALGFAFAQPPWLILIFFLLIGLGLSMPFLLLGFNPKLMKVIPKPGEWMNVFKEIMGFLLIATSIWLLHVVYQQTNGEYLLSVIIYLACLSFAAWLYGRFVRLENSKVTQWIFTLIALLIVVSSAYIFLSQDKQSEKTDKRTESTGLYKPAFGAPEGWLEFSPELVNKLIEQGEPVFIDFGAKWCMTCITNEKTVVFSDEMAKEFKAKKVRLVRGDYTKKNPLIHEWMKRYGRAGVPFNILYIPNKEPVLFDELLTVSAVKSALQQIP